MRVPTRQPTFPAGAGSRSPGAPGDLDAVFLSMSDEFEIKMPAYKPSAFYYRRALRGTKDPKKVREIGLAVVEELERLKAWVSDQGLIPPKWQVMPEEAEEKGWGVIERLKAE